MLWFRKKPVSNYNKRNNDNNLKDTSKGFRWSSRPHVFCKKGVLSNFTKFTGKHLCQSPFFNKVAGFWRRCLSVNFAKFLRTSFFTEHLRRLPLTVLETSKKVYKVMFFDMRKYIPKRTQYTIHKIKQKC